MSQQDAGFFYEEKKIRAFFLLFMDSLRSRPPGPPLVPGGIFTHSFRLSQNKVAKLAFWVPLEWVKSNAWIREKKINKLQGLGVGPSMFV